jgi:hypothetical protein
MKAARPASQRITFCCTAARLIHPWAKFGIEFPAAMSGSSPTVQSSLHAVIAICHSSPALTQCGCNEQEPECVKREPAVRAALSKMYRSGKNVGVLHDMKCTGAMHPLSSDVIKVTNAPAAPLVL